MTTLPSSSSSSAVILSLLSEDELKCASCLKEQNSADNLEDEVFFTNIDPDDPSKCNHRFCLRCKINNFNKKRTFACPICQSTVKESNLKQQTYDDYEIKRDIKIRKRIKSIYNKTESDFKNLLEFQNYEEYVEDLIYNLVHNINKDITEKLIYDYEHSHMKEITKKQMEINHHNQLIEESIAKQEEDKVLKSRLYHDNLKLTKLKEIEFQKNMNNYVISGEGDYAAITLQNSSNTNLPPKSNSLAAAVVTTSMSSSIHPLYILLRQRPEPKPMAVEPPSSITNHISKTIVHTAGGFNPNIYMERNMRELLSAFDESFYVVSGSPRSRRKYKYKSKGCDNNSNNSHNDMIIG